jgi:hypothetical protein
MTASNFAIQVEPQRDLVRITLSGFFVPADVSAFVAARNKAHAGLRCTPNAHLTLVDVRGLKIQPQEAVTAFRAMLSAPEHRSRRLAFITSSTLARNQLTRAVGTRTAHFFVDAAEAETWLFEGDRPQS